MGATGQLWHQKYWMNVKMDSYMWLQETGVDCKQCGTTVYNFTLRNGD